MECEQKDVSVNQVIKNEFDEFPSIFKGNSHLLIHSQALRA